MDRIYAPKLEINNVNATDTEAAFLDLHLSISNGFVSSKNFDMRNEFDFDIVTHPFSDGDVPHSIILWGYLLLHFTANSICQQCPVM